MCDILKEWVSSSEDVVERVFFLIQALVAFLYDGTKPFGHFGRGLNKKHLCEIILNLSMLSPMLVVQEMSFEIFLIFNSGDHLARWRGTN